MKKDYAAIINDICNASEHHNLTFFVGAGVSRCSGAKGWGESIKEIYLKLNGVEKENFSTDEFLSIAEAFYHHSKSEYEKYLIANFYDPHLEPNKIHDLFFQFNPASFITTNFDELLEKAAVKNCKTFISVSKEDEITSVNGERFIIKAHGDCRRKNMVFKDSDYLNYSTEHKLIDTLIKSVFASNLVVFIGYGLQDYTIRYILNWVHNRLKGKFKPIFIYTDTNKLLQSDIEYQEARGLRIVDWHDFSMSGKKNAKFINRYLSVLESFSSGRQEKFLYNKNKENFDLLYKKLQPLNKFFALRHEDIINALKYYVDIDSAGLITTIPSRPDILKLFLDYTVEKDNKKIITDKKSKEYKIISQVFRKAGIVYAMRKGKKIKFEKNYIADKNIILFDYKRMLSFVSKNFSSLSQNYKKAYYLFCLGRYKESYDLYQHVAYDAFYDKNFLLYYFSQKNLYNLHEMKLHNSFLYDFTETMNIPKYEEEIFAGLPQDFKTLYSQFDNLYTSNALHKNIYKAKSISEKMENTNSTNSVELGETSFSQGINFIYNVLHFVLGNFLLSDNFAEFKSSIMLILNEQLFQYSEVGKKAISRIPFSSFKNYPIIFDEIDIFCFINYYSEKELQCVFSKYKIKTLNVLHESLINKIVLNLFCYYSDQLSSTDNNHLLCNYCKKLKTCLELFCHVKLYKETVEKVIYILFNKNLYDISLSLRWKFINSQDEMGNINENSRKSILKFILNNINNRKEISMTKKVVNDTNDSDYTRFIKFIKKENGSSLTDLDTIVFEILEKYQNYPINELLCYSPFVNTNNKTKIRDLTTKKLKKEFDVTTLNVLVSIGEKITNDEIKIIHKYLDENILQKKSDFLHEKQKYILSGIGFLCFIGELPREDFLIYLHNDSLFDFLLSPESFNKSNFEVQWITEKFINIHEDLSKNPYTKEIINEELAKVIKSNKCTFADRKNFEELYFKYYV